MSKLEIIEGKQLHSIRGGVNSGKTNYILGHALRVATWKKKVLVIHSQDIPEAFIQPGIANIACSDFYQLESALYGAVSMDFVFIDALDDFSYPDGESLLNLVESDIPEGQLRSYAITVQKSPTHS